MSVTTIALLTVGFSFGLGMVLLFSSLRLRNLRTVPKPQVLNPEVLKNCSAETRAGISLQEACFNNDVKAASEALTMWAWANGDPNVANSLDQKMTSLQNPDFRMAIEDLWIHLEPSDKRQWFGDQLWNAFLATNPEFHQMEITV